MIRIIYCDSPSYISKGDKIINRFYADDNNWFNSIFSYKVCENNFESTLNYICEIANLELISITRGENKSGFKTYVFFFKEKEIEESNFI